jgi:hypothetical protein
MKYYEVKMTCTEGGYLSHTVEAVNATVAVAMAIAHLHDAQSTPVEIAEVTCRVVKHLPQWVG